MEKKENSQNFKRVAQKFELLFNKIENSNLPGPLKNRYFISALVLGAFILFISLFSGLTGEDSNIPTFKVKKDNFLVSITESGEIKAKNSKVISAPRVRGQLKITYMIPEGTYVNPGDTVLKFDQSEAKTKLFEAQSQLDLTLSEKLKLKANHKSSAAQMESNLKSAKLNFELSKLNLKQMKFEAEAERQKAKLQFQKDSLSYIQTLQDFESKKIIRESELAKMEIEIRQKKSELDRAERDKDMLILAAPSEGLIVYDQNWSTNQKFAVGDQPWRGQSIMTLPDLSTMQSKTYVNEVDVSKVAKNLEVEVKLDAFQDTTFTGIIADVAKLGKKKDRNSNIKVFDITVDIKGNSEILKPGMTTSNKIIIKEFPDKIFIPIEAVYNRGGQSFVYVKNGFGFDEREVEVDTKSEDYIIVTKGLIESEVIALRDPNEDLDSSTQGMSLPNRESN